MKTEKLKGLIAERGLSGAKLAPMLGMSAKTFYSKMRSGNFTLREAENIARIVQVPNPAEIFFGE